MTKPVIRYLRLFCSHPGAEAETRRDGVVAVAAIYEHAALARLLLVDMGLWGRNEGATVTSAFEKFMVAGHRQLISRFGIPLDDTLVVARDSAGHFDWIAEGGDGLGYRCSPMLAMGRPVPARSREAFLSWAGIGGETLLEKADSVGAGAWADVEG